MNPRNARLAAPIALLIAAAALPLAAQEIYKTIDEDGNVVYTDQKPSEDAKPLKLPELTIVDAERMPDRAPSTGSSETQTIEPVEVEFRIASPEPDEIIVNTGYRVDVRVELGVDLPPGAQVAYYVDGELKKTVPSLSTTLEEVFRGPHELRAELQTSGGRVLAETGAVSFFMRQHSRLQPN
ncbi:MAG: DUF4124 domain-containing protein [Wenzhouxiangellaceae bacterium]|nr:DUF4124 domain-containing protein [Wenzhouxiangellaceae bacterium]